MPETQALIFLKPFKIGRTESGEQGEDKSFAMIYLPVCEVMGTRGGWLEELKVTGRARTPRRRAACREERRAVVLR